MQPFGYAYNQYLQKRINIHSTERGVKIVLKAFGVYAWTRRKTALYLSKIYLDIFSLEIERVYVESVYEFFIFVMKNCNFNLK